MIGGERCITPHHLRARPGHYLLRGKSGLPATTARAGSRANPCPKPLAAKRGLTLCSSPRRCDPVHQGLKNRLIHPAVAPAKSGAVNRHARLGGVLNFCSREGSMPSSFENFGHHGRIRSAIKSCFSAVEILAGAGQRPAPASARAYRFAGCSSIVSFAVVTFRDYMSRRQNKQAADNREARNRRPSDRRLETSR